MPLPPSPLTYSLPPTPRIFTLGIGGRGDPGVTKKLFQLPRDCSWLNSSELNPTFGRGRGHVTEPLQLYNSKIQSRHLEGIGPWEGKRAYVPGETNLPCSVEGMEVVFVILFISFGFYVSYSSVFILLFCQTRIGKWFGGIVLRDFIYFSNSIKMNRIQYNRIHMVGNQVMISIFGCVCAFGNKPVVLE